MRVRNQSEGQPTELTGRRATARKLLREPVLRESFAPLTNGKTMNFDQVQGAALQLGGEIKKRWASITRQSSSRTNVPRHSGKYTGLSLFAKADRLLQHEIQ